MLTTAEAYVDAHQQLSRAETPDEKHLAAERFIEAEAAHLEKLGIQRKPQGFFFRVFVPTFAVAMVALLFVLVTVSAIRASSAADKASEAAATAAQAAADVALLQRQNVSDQRESCARSNEARQNAVDEKRAELREQRTGLKLWNLALAAQPDPEAQPPDPKVLGAFTVYLHRLGAGVRSKARAIHGLIAPYKEVAVEPGSPVVDCKKAFPQRTLSAVGPHR